MKRNMELIKLLLLEQEDKAAKIPDEYSEGEILYHIALCEEAKLIHGSILRDSQMDIKGAVTWGLTWEGHEFLDAARNQNVWNKTITALKAHALTVPFEILKTLLTAKLKQEMGV